MSEYVVIQERTKHHCLFGDGSWQNPIVGSSLIPSWALPTEASGRLESRLDTRSLLVVVSVHVYRLRELHSC